MATDSTPGSFVCVVCGAPATFAMSAECNWCDGRYHLNQRNDREAKDCGAVWIDEQFLALQFACNNCLQSDGGAAPPRSRDVAAARERRAPARRRYRRRE